MDTDRRLGPLKQSHGRWVSNLKDRVGSLTYCRLVIPLVLSLSLVLSTASAGLCGGRLTVTVTDQALNPLQGAKVSWFTAADEFIGCEADTDVDGKAVCHLPAKHHKKHKAPKKRKTAISFKVKISYLGHTFWSDTFDDPDTRVTIPMGEVQLTVTGVGHGLEGVPVDVYSGSGKRLPVKGDTDSNGQVGFSLPEGRYLFKAAYQGKLFESQPLSVQAGHSAQAVIDTGGGILQLTVQKDFLRPIANAACYFYTDSEKYTGVHGATDDQGLLNVQLSDGSYKIKIEYAAGTFWSDPFGVPQVLAKTITIAHQYYPVFVQRLDREGPQPVAGMQLYAYTGDNQCVGVSPPTDAHGRTAFDLPPAEYKIKYYFNGPAPKSRFPEPGRSDQADPDHGRHDERHRKPERRHHKEPDPKPRHHHHPDQPDANRVQCDEHHGKPDHHHPGRVHWAGPLSPAGLLISLTEKAGGVLPAVESLSATVTLPDTVDLTWPALKTVRRAAPAGYAIYRRQACQPEFTRITAEPLDPGATSYRDTLADPAGRYIYYIAGVGRHGVQGLASPLAAADFPSGPSAIAGITNFHAAWQQGHARLTWDSQAGLSYLVYRGAGPEALSPLQRVPASPFIDPASDPLQTYYYQVAALQSQCDPQSGQNLELQGPRSALIMLAALDPATALADIQINGQGDYLIATGADGSYTLQGSYSNLVGTVTVTATLDGQTVTGTCQDGQFSIQLPCPGNWQITISDDNQSTTLNTVWEIDDKAPELIIDGPAQRSTSQSQITISGRVQDEQSALQSVAVTSDRYPGLTFAAGIGPLGAFSGQVPLKTGANQLTVTAADIHGNTAAKQIGVTLELTALPVITITSPADGSSVTTARIDVAGSVRSSLPPEKIRLVLGNQVDFPSGTNGEYTFAFNDVDLVQGANTLTVRAETAYGNVSAQTTVRYITATGDDQVALPQIEVFSPLPDRYLSASPIVTGRATSDIGIQAVSVNGQAAQTTGIGTTYVSFKAPLAFDVAQQSAGITITAIDSADQSNTLTYSVYLDATPPAITLNANAEAPPAVNITTQSPYAIAGTITEAHLAGASINDQPIALSPSTQADTYTFNAGLPLTYGDDQPITLAAWDFAGNRTSTEWIVRLSSNLVIEVITPRDGAELQGQGDTTDVAVTVRVAGAQADDMFKAAVNAAAAQTMERSGDMGHITFAVPTAQAEHSLTISVEDSSGTVLSSTRTRFSILNMDAIPLAVERQEPENGATGVETNDFIALYFNKPIDPAKLTIEVLETAHGQTYAAAQSGADITQLSHVELIDVHRDREPVPGGIAHFPQNRMAAFYPSRDLAYGADIFVTAVHDGEELSRATFKVRPLPTFIEGFVANTSMTPLQGIVVSLPGLGLQATTNAEGAFAFGFGMGVDKAIPGGRYKAIVNPDMHDRNFGIYQGFVQVVEGRLNSMPVIRLTAINPALPFRRILSGQSQAVLAGGDLTLDLSKATLTFADLRDQGDVYVQFTPCESLAHPIFPATTAHWLFALQPAGIEVSGTVGLSIGLPERNGGYTYLDDYGEYAVLLGLDPEAMTIMPVGVGRIDKDLHRVTSQGEVRLQRLDYIGYALLTTDFQSVLTQYAGGDINLRQLIAQLDALAQNTSQDTAQ